MQYSPMPHRCAAIVYSLGIPLANRHCLVRCRQWRPVLKELRPDSGKGSAAQLLAKHYRRLLLALEADLCVTTGAKVRLPTGNGQE